MRQFRVGIDIGGTFTDVVFMGEDGRVIVTKVSSSIENYSSAIIRGVSAVMAEHGIAANDIIEIVHGTTVASNTILEHKGARTALVTTKGFRDVLEIRNLRMPKLYDLGWSKPPSLVRRRLRLELNERMSSKGEVLVPLTDEEIDRVVGELAKLDVEAIAVCLLHSYVNPEHEIRLRDAIAARLPERVLSVSSDLLPVAKEYERTSTTVVNAYVKPIIAHYLESLISEFARIGVTAPLLLMQSNGGLIPAASAAEMPVNIVESGPAAGVVGAQRVAQISGVSKVISFDMGGTTAKASVVEDGQVSRSEEFSVGGGIMIGSRLMSGGGYVLKVPAIDLAEVGAGGGSQIWIDAGGLMKIGPESAGSNPGPVCYDIGGKQATVTDANVVLGYINPEGLAGGSLKIKPELARKAIEEQVATRMGIPVEVAAYGAHQIAASNMIRAIKAVTSERGRDPRDFALVAFGGNGALFAAGMASTLAIRTVIVPPSPGVFSAFGLLYSDIERHHGRAFRVASTAADPAAISAAFEEIERDAAAEFLNAGTPGNRIRMLRHAKVQYLGQAYELTVPVSPGELGAGSIDTLAEDFAQEHERTYGHRAPAGEPIEIVSLGVVARIISDASRTAPALRLVDSDTRPRHPRRAYFGPAHGWAEAKVISRADTAGSVAGPCIVEEYDATTIVPPGARAELDAQGNIVLTLGATATKSDAHPVVEAAE
ncbi:MAG TPA: hydantoinase/oxoprolinase family protein [Rhizobiaceae bacterium]|nr:hydantoinase/oxoprolinase family protein [Rhizobiaceae bacterium]